MGIRTVCFLLAFVTDGWVRWACVALAVVLPYIAVMVANAGRERTKSPQTFVANPMLGGLPRTAGPEQPSELEPPR